MQINFENLHNGKADGQHRCFTARNFYGVVVFGHYQCQIRFFATQSGAVHCRFSLHSPDGYAVYYGVGSASGYGYDKASAAMVYAMRDIGLEPDTHPGQGYTTVMAELSAALEEAGYDTENIIAIFE